MHCGRAKTLEDGTVRQWSNQRLHEHWRIPPVSVEVAVKRIGWLKAMLRDEANHTLALAAICGRFLGRDVLEEKGGLCEGANPFAVAFHRDVYLLQGVTGTEELCEALRKVGFQSLFVSQSEAWEALQRIDTSLLRAACWTMASGMRLERHVKAQCGETCKFDWCCEILSEYGVPCGSRFRSKKALRCHQLRSRLHGHGHQTSVFASVITNYCPWCRSTFVSTLIARKHAAAMLSGHCRVDAGAFLWPISPFQSLQCRLCDVGDTRPLTNCTIMLSQSTCPSHLLSVYRLRQRCIMPAVFAVLDGTPGVEDVSMGEEVKKRRLTRRKSAAGGRGLTLPNGKAEAGG